MAEDRIVSEENVSKTQGRRMPDQFLLSIFKSWQLDIEGSIKLFRDKSLKEDIK